MDKWISVKDRLPPANKKLLVYGFDDFLNCETITIDKMLKDGEYLLRPKKFITHWMLAPEPPEK